MGRKKKTKEERIKKIREKYNNQLEKLKEKKESEIDRKINKIKDISGYRKTIVKLTYG